MGHMLSAGLAFSESADVFPKWLCRFSFPLVSRSVPGALPSWQHLVLSPFHSHLSRRCVRGLALQLVFLTTDGVHL